MIVIVRSAPDTPDGRKGIDLGAGMGADLVLIQNGLYFAGSDALQGFAGKVYALEDDARLRGIRLEKGGRIEAIGYGAFVELAAAEAHVIGAF
ncbi:MAG: DsrH/TusB family sulfur metabolism protein [Nitrospiraceae bacterium]|nr:DsrH/TusB family sulfur metabolism protein [Nitrospiraceae bacterium]